MTVPTDTDAFGRIHGVDTFGNALPVLAVTDDRGLHLEPYPSDGEAAYTLVAPWRVKIEVPARERVAVSGGATRTTHAGNSVYTAHARVRDVAFAIGQLAVRTNTVDGVRVQVFAGPSDHGELSQAVRNTSRVFAAYQRWYGHSYRLPDFDVLVARTDFGGQEYPGFVLTTADLPTVAHEVAHQWFYALVGNDQYDDPWLDESFATYNEEQFSPADYPCDVQDPLHGARHGLAVGMRYWSAHPSTYDTVVYGDGSCALTRLEHDLGHQRFFTVLRDEIADFGNQVVRTADFLHEVHRVAPRYDVHEWARLVGLSS